MIYQVFCCWSLKTQQSEQNHVIIRVNFIMNIHEYLWIYMYVNVLCIFLFVYFYNY